MSMATNISEKSIAQTDERMNVPEREAQKAIPKTFLAVSFTGVLLLLGICIGRSIAVSNVQPADPYSFSVFGAIACVVSIPCILLCTKFSEKLAVLSASVVLLAVSALAAMTV